MASIEIATFNMQYGQPWDAGNPDGAPLDLEQTLDAIEALSADIVLLQEVEKVGSDGSQVEPPPNYARIRERFPHYDGFFSYPRFDREELPFGFGLAILSRFPLSDQETLDLPAPDIEFDFFGSPKKPTGRLLIGAKTEVGGKPLQILNTHLQAFFIIGHSSDDHPAQRDEVANRLAACRMPTILGGDFNIAPGEGTLTALAKMGFEAAPYEVPTWKRMPYKMDHLFANSGVTFETCEVVPTQASDHEIVRARIRLGD